MRAAPALLGLTLLLSGCADRIRSRPDPRPTPPVDGPTEAPVATVPDVRGLALADARGRLEMAGFYVGLVEPWPDSLGYAAGTVVAQRPARGTSNPSGTPVDLRVFGITAEEARQAMADSRPLPTDVAPAPPPPSSGDTPPPIPPSPPVVRVPPPAPRPPSPAPPARSGLEGNAQVPDLVGLTLDEASRRARASGFEIVPLRVTGGTPGIVASQDLPAGREAPVGSPIGVRVGK